MHLRHRKTRLVPASLGGFPKSNILNGADRLHDSTFSVSIILHILLGFKYNIYGAIDSVDGQSEARKGRWLAMNETNITLLLLVVLVLLLKK